MNTLFTIPTTNGNRTREKEEKSKNWISHEADIATFWGALHNVMFLCDFQASTKWVRWSSSIVSEIQGQLPSTQQKQYLCHFQ